VLSAAVTLDKLIVVGTAADHFNGTSFTLSANSGPLYALVQIKLSYLTVHNPE
jgi:hypothetical protein